MKLSNYIQLSLSTNPVPYICGLIGLIGLIGLWYRIRIYGDEEVLFFFFSMKAGIKINHI